MSEEQATGRSRRARTKVDYSIEQQFSEEDIFEEGDEEEKVPASAKRKSRGRKSTGAGVVASSIMDSGISFERSKPVYTEKGYDPSLPPIRERFTFEPEYEDDGTPKIELIVGRRLIEDTKDRTQSSGDGRATVDDGDENETLDDTSKDGGSPARRIRSRSNPQSEKSKPSSDDEEEAKVAQSEMEYEYLLKYKGRSYLHLEWKTAADLESMNKGAKTIYRRFLKKIEAGTEEDLEDPTVDPSYTEPGRILAEEEHEIMVELSDKELVKWQKEQSKELEDIDDESEGDEEDSQPEQAKESQQEKQEEKMEEETIEIGAPGTMNLDQLRSVIKREEPYYPTYPGSDNPYRDGYFTEPPKKPRPSYLFYQGIYRSWFAKRNPGASVAEIMQMLGDSWRELTEDQQAPYFQLAKEESEQYEKEKLLLERAQRPTEVWQPIRRCQAVLDRLCNDPMASIFLEPVDTSIYTDYLDIIDSPMDLGTVRENLKAQKNYMGPESFARDVRKIWNNCKIFNQHGSAIWHVADYMSKQFERLYHAWVLDFRDRYLRWANPAARPWEPSCRSCNGACKTQDNLMVLCDHCDAMYGISCLKPKLKKVPKGAWHCPSCAPKVKKNLSVSILSAVTEQAARKRAEIGDAPKKQVKQKMFLVKWAGLGYEHCTWETQEDINDDAIIAEFRRREGVTPEEPELSEQDVRRIIEAAVTATRETSAGNQDMSFLRSQLYAQTRSFQFTKFGADIPKFLRAECGPYSHAVEDDSLSICNPRLHPEEVRKCLSEIVHSVSFSKRDISYSHHSASLPPLLFEEYDVVLPVTSKGLLLNVGESNGVVQFLGYRQLPSGKGPAEVANLVRSPGDLIIAVNGKSTVGKTFAEVIGMLKENVTYAYIRFLSSPNKIAEVSSCGKLGRYLYKNISTRCKADRRRLLAKRALASEAYKDESSTSSEDLPDDSDNDSDDSQSASDLEPDSDDEDLLLEKHAEGSRASESDNETSRGAEGRVGEYKEPRNDYQDYDGEEKKAPESEEASEQKPALQNTSTSLRKPVTHRQKSTQCLAFELLGIDVGYSSDEGGDEGNAYFFDGVDASFSRSMKLSPGSKGQPVVSEAEGISSSECGSQQVIAKEKDAPKAIYPVKKDEFSLIGRKSQLQVAIALTNQEPDPDDFDNFPFPSSKEIQAARSKAEAAARALEEQKLKEAAALKEAQKPKVKSTTKVEQISTLTNEIVHIWASAEDAASTMQIPLKDIRLLLKGTYDADLGDEAGGYRWRYADEDAEVTETVSSGRDSKKGKQAFLQFRDKLYDPKKPHIYKDGHKLRDYQVDGVNWLSSCYYKRSGAILADEMGLGKTVQIVSYLEHLYRVEKLHGPFLVVVPLSTVEHWRREFEGWTDMQCCVYHDRQRVWRDVLREYEFYYQDRPHTPDYLKFNVLVTTYDTLIGDFDVIGDIPWRVTVVDEAHRLRNVKGKLLECMKEISAKGTLKYGFQSRVLMTGTPLQNNTQELWTLLNFIEPGLFQSLEDFEESFGNMANREQVEALQRKISPFMLRRVKEDVAKDIPAKEETVIDVELTSIQKQYYRAIFEHNHAFLSMGSAKAVTPKLMNIQMELRKCCNHPFLLDGIESREMEKRREELQKTGELDGKSPEEQHNILNEYGYVLSSGKMVLLDKLLPKLRQEGHKVLIFSQFVKMLDLISDYCDFRNFNYERLDGRVRGNERQKAIDRFETQSDSFVFLLSTRAGGVGINLTAADICIIFDSDWNPQNDVQAQARCHRIGQTKDVMIYRLVTSRTFEQEMFDRASKKLGLEQAVLGTFGQDNDDDKPTSKEMETLLKRGAYALLEDENDEIGNEFVADDIENILAKRTRTRVVEGAKTASWLNKSGLSVTKSKFSSEAGGASLDIDDPDFWQKVMPDFITPAILISKIAELEAAFEKPVKGGRPSKTRSDDNEKGLSRGNIKKVKEFMVDLKGVMEDMFEQDREDTLSAADKSTCQKLLLMVSVKDKLFTEDQRNIAKKLLARLEGDRRRKCRASEGRAIRGGVDDNDLVSAGPSVREELLIVSSKKKRKRGTPRKGEDAASGKDFKGTQGRDSEIDGDGFKLHSDDEADWSDVEDSNAKSISLKEAQRRREWGAGKDEMTAAALPWPVFPRNAVTQVLTTLIDEVIKIDSDFGGMFSVPVPRDEFPDYYELIKNPMDYGTMKKKLENGEYRSAQAMQKDFILIMQNCLAYNTKDSDIVKEAKRQTLMRPKLLKDAALKNNLFIHEDGSVIEIHDDAMDTKKKTGSKAKDGAAKSPKKKEKTKLVACGKCDGCQKKACKKCDACKRKKRCLLRACSNVKRVVFVSSEKTPGRMKENDSDEGSDQETPPAEPKGTPRIRLRVLLGNKSSSSKKRKITVHQEANENESESGGTKVTSSRKRARLSNGRRNTRSPVFTQQSDEESDDYDEMFDVNKIEAAHKKLNGASFIDARNNFVLRGPWRLPKALESNESSFKEVAKITLINISRYDTYSIFKEPVSEAAAPGYYDVIKHPMDFGTMKTKVDKGKYGEGSKAAAKFYKDFLLTFDNCASFNEEGDVLEEATTILAALPLMYAKACEEALRSS